MQKKVKILRYTFIFFFQHIWNSNILMFFAFLKDLSLQAIFGLQIAV